MFILFQISNPTNGDSPEKNIFINESEIISIVGENTKDDFKYRLYLTENAYKSLFEAGYFESCHSYVTPNDKEFSLRADESGNINVYCQIVKLLKKSAKELGYKNQLEGKNISAEF